MKNLNPQQDYQSHPKDSVPLAFRAQIPGRCQLQRIDPELQKSDPAWRGLNQTEKDKRAKEKSRENYAYVWADQWLSAVNESFSNTDLSKLHARGEVETKKYQTKSYKISWRLITNSGQDESIIRPVISGKGIPTYPGSSMKGAFRRAFGQFSEKHPDRLRDLKSLLEYCGSTVKESASLKPGILRFHGAIPVDDAWRDKREMSVVDLVHPQESWQVGSLQPGNNKKGASFVISLLRPTLRFGISSKEELSEEEWKAIWDVWEMALGYGIGSRVSAGYGHIDRHDATKILSVSLKGEGLLSKRVDGSPELRPNMFKAALRGHTLRLFGGVTDARTAEELTKKLWGGFAGRDGSVVGELGTAFDYDSKNLAVGSERVPTFEISEGYLNILWLNARDRERKEELEQFATELLKFSMLLGGFGKSWRRASHSIFFQDYFRGHQNTKDAIGVHWEFLKDGHYILFDTIQDIQQYFKSFDTYIRDYVKRQKNARLMPDELPKWREAWCPENAQVWAYIHEEMSQVNLKQSSISSEIKADPLARPLKNGKIQHRKSMFNDISVTSKALTWLHKKGDENYAIKKTHLSGELGKIGRIWHRMYPRFVKQDDRVVQRGFVELLTIFPNRQAQGKEYKKQQDFLNFLSQQSDFKKVFGN